MLLLVALAAYTAGAPPDGAWARDGGRPDAEVFATSNRATIADADDPRLRTRLRAFARVTTTLIRRGGGDPGPSELLDGVFWSSDRGAATFERSRRFPVDSVSPRELRAVAERVRRRFGQESVLTFDHLPRRSRRVDAIVVEVPGVTSERLRDALVADRAAQRRLVGGSVTLDRRLLLVAGLGDRALARRFVERLGADWRVARVRHGRREFVG
jgi:hypothetical protein